MGKVFITLNRVRFKNTMDWDVNVISRASVTSKYDIRKLSDCIIEQNLKYDISNPNQEYKILGVNNQIGIFDAYIENGSKINQKYKKMENGWIAYNPYRINVGSIGIKKIEQKYEYISPAYVVFSCNENLNSEFLYYLMKTQQFNKIIRENTTGTVRQNLSFGNLKNLEIPCPIPSIQAQLVTNYKDKLSKAVLLENKANKIEEEIDDFLQNKLGISPKKSTQSTTACEPAIEFVTAYQTIGASANTYILGQEPQKTYKYLKSVRYKKLKTWDSSNVLQPFNEILNNSYYRIEELGNIYKFVNRAWKKNTETFRYIELGSVDPLNGVTKAEKLQTHKAPSRATQIVKKGDLIIGTTRPYLKKFAIIDSEFDNCVASSGFQVISPNNNYNLNYLCEYLKTPTAISQFELFMAGALYPAINSTDLKKIRIPLPPIDIQNEIATHISELRSQIQKLKQEAITLRETAFIEFENEIFE